MFQLTSTKDRENKTTLLQFLVEYAERDYPEVLNFSDELMHLVWFQLCSQALAIYSQEWGVNYFKLLLCWKRSSKQRHKKSPKSHFKFRPKLT